MNKFKSLFHAAAMLPLYVLKTYNEYLRCSDGNKKLQPDNRIKYIIWNLPAVITCPFSTALCRKYCYAKKAETGARPSVKPARMRNYKQSKKDCFPYYMIFTILCNLNRKSYINAETVVIRIHESGDFYNRDYVKKWLRVARFFSYDNRVVFMAYTKSIEYFNGLKVPDNMIIRFSLWDDTASEQKALAEKMRLPIYTAVERFTDEKPVNRCLCKNCSTCQKCWSNIDKLICEIH